MDFSDAPGPLKRDGTPDMRYEANKEYVASRGGMQSLLQSQDRTPPSRSSAARSTGNVPSAASASYAVNSAIYSDCPGPLKMDGTPDMRYSKNKEYVKSRQSELSDLARNLNESSLSDPPPWRQFLSENRGRGWNMRKFSAEYRKLWQEAIAGRREDIEARLSNIIRHIAPAEDGADEATVHEMCEDMMEICTQESNRREVNDEIAKSSLSVRDNSQWTVVSDPRTSDGMAIAPVRRENRDGPKLIPLSEIELDMDKEIGEGGFGKVYFGKFKGAAVAVKRLRNIASNAQLKAVEKELASLATLDGPFFVRLWGYAVETDRRAAHISIVMDYYEDGSLSDVLLGLQPEDALKKAQYEHFASCEREIILQVLEAVACMHKQGIAHRDLKLANILADVSKTHVALCDFGLASVKNEAISAGTTRDGGLRGFVGTIKYAAPEIHSGDMDDRDLQQLYAADVYSLAITIAEILLQTDIYFGLNPNRIAKLVCEENLRPIEALDKCPNEEIRSVLQRAWDADWKKRPTAAELYDTFCKHWKPARKALACCICADEYPLIDGIRCGNGQLADGNLDCHFFCRSCFVESVENACNEDVAVIKERQGLMYCPCHPSGCESAPFSDAIVNSMVPVKVFDKFIEVRTAYRGQEIADAEIAALRQREEAEAEAARQRTADEQAAFVAIKHIREEIMTLKCPKCKCAFVDFNGCFALTCRKCGCGFCAWCLKDCGHDAHRHVASCRVGIQYGSRGEVFGNPDAFNWCHNNRRIEQMNAYVKAQKLTPGALHLTMEGLRPNLRELGIRQD